MSPPKTGTPIVEPSMRNSSAVDVAVPRSDEAAEFCTASSDGCIMKPAPSPTSRTKNATRTVGVVRVSIASNAIPAIANRAPTIGHGLIRPPRSTRFPESIVPKAAPNMTGTSTSPDAVGVMRWTSCM